MDDGSNYGEDCAQLSQLHDLNRSRMQKIINISINKDDPIWKDKEQMIEFYKKNFNFILKYAVARSPFILNNVEKLNDIDF